MKTLIMSVVTAFAAVACVGAVARAQGPVPVLTDDGILTDTLPFNLVDDGCGGVSVADPNGQPPILCACDRFKIYLADADDAVPYYYTYPYVYPYAYPYTYPYAYPYPYYYGYVWGGYGWGGYDRDDFRGHGTATPFFRGGGGGGVRGGMGGHGGGGHR